MRVSLLVGLVCAMAFSLSGCAAPGSGTAAPTPLPDVSPAAAQPLPGWIESISPTGQAAAGAQIRIRFKNDVIPLDSLESPDRQAALSHFKLEPALPGRFIFLTPRMAGFEADAPLPQASRLRVTLTSGLADLSGHGLSADFVWTFTTAPIALHELTGHDTKDADLVPDTLRPELSFDSNVALDERSLEAHAQLVDTKTGGAPPAGLSVVHEPTPAPGDQPDAQYVPAEGETIVHYTLRPTGDLAAGTHYKFALAPGIAPARGNLASAAGYEGNLLTRGPLAFGGTSSTDPQSSNARFAAGDPVLNFSNGLDAASARKAISVVPAPDASLPLIGVDDGGQKLYLNAYALTPRTHYTVTVAATLKDRFGQQLGAPASATFDTGALAASIWAPSGFSIFPAGADIKLNLETVNLPGNTYRAAYRTVTPQELLARDPATPDSALALLPPADRWAKASAPAGPDRVIDTPVDLRAKLGASSGLLAYAASAVLPGASAASATTLAGIVQLTNIGIFAQWFPDGGLVRVAHLSDGSPLAGARLEVYESTAGSSDANAKPNSTPCASGRSDATGTWNLDGATFARCASTATNAQNAPELFVVAREGQDWAFVRTWQWSGYDAGVYLGWSAGTPDSRGTILSDRTLYQPGETAQFAGIAYFDVDGTLRRGRAAAYDLTLEDPAGKKSALGRRSLDPFGAFSFSVPIGGHATVGYYTVTASASNGETLTGTYRVAEFKPPNFKVDLKLDGEFARSGAQVQAASSSMYLFGAPVSGGTAHFYVTRSRAFFTPKGRDDYSFGRSWFYPEEPPSVPPDVLQTDVKIDAAGNAALPVPVATGLPYPMLYRVDAETTDASNLSVSDSKSFTAFASDALIGLRGDFVVTSGAAFEVSTIVTDPRGAALSGRKVHLVLQRRDFASATQLVEGSETPADSIHYVDVASVDVVSAGDAIKASLTAPKPGSYRVHATFSENGDEGSATDLDLWVAGPGEADWGQADGTQLTVKLDKPSYKPGDTATALLQSPYPEADVFFAVIRHGVLYRTTQHVTGAAPQIRFSVTPAMLPNAAVEAVLVRRGKPLAQINPAGLGKLARIGMAAFNVALDSKYLNVEVKAQVASLQPGSRQHLSVQLRDASGKPVAGEVTLAVVNDAILQLTGYRFPDLVKIVYAQDPISTRWADNRSDVRLVTEKQSVDKGFGYGGGASAGLGSTRVRSNFKALAFWEPALRTGANGAATVDFLLPDDLTTWRVMVLALTQDARFGNGEASFIATKPLVTNPILPQFARPGDAFSLGVAVTDVARTKGTLDVRATLGGDLVFADGSRQATLQQPLDASNAAYRFDVRATGSTPAQVTFKTALGGNADAFTLPLPVQSDDSLETVATSGATTDAASSVPLDVPDGAAGPFGGLDLTLASTLLGETREPARQLEKQRPPFALGIASRIAIAADSLLLDKQFGNSAGDARLRTILTGDLSALETLALPDGSYAPWPGAKAGDIWSTAFAATALGQARSAGANVDGALAHAERFLKARLADPGPECARDAACRAAVRLEALETLGTLGKPRNDFLSDIWARRDALSYGERAELARLLLKLPDWHAQGLQLRDKLLEQVYESARRATVNDPGAGESPVAAQAQMLALLVESGTPAERVDKVLTSLLALRRNGTWGCSCDDAEALNALVTYAKTAGPPGDFSVAASVGDAKLRAVFQGYKRTLTQGTFPLGGATGVPAGKSTLAFSKSGAGTLHYTVALRYKTPDVSAGAYAGIRIDRFVRAANDPKVLAQFGLSAVAADAIHLPAAAVYEIEDRIIADHPLDDAIVTDPLPAGLEAVDTSFQTATQFFQGNTDAWQIDYQQIYRDHVIAFAQHLPAGVYAVHYLVRSVTPGSFAWPGASVQLQYAPEEFGRTASTRLTIEPGK
jgi:uncharacterized protein YfaS (alpha-2-macroglobulin family)